MAVMTEQQLSDTYRNTVRGYMDDLLELGMTKAEIRAAVDVIDLYFSNEAANINALLPLPFRTLATNQMKAFLFAKVTEQRFNVDV